jgi:hypothetical protein
MGFLSGTAGAEKVQIRYYSSDTYTLTSQNLPGNIIEVSVENYQWGWMVPLMRSATPLSMTARAADLMESLPGGSQPPAR